MIIDQSQSQLRQVARQLGTTAEGNLVRLPKECGEGFVRKTELPGGLELNHYHFTLRQPISMHSTIPKDADTYLLNINLTPQVNRELSGNQMADNKSIPTGCFFYSPGIEAHGKSPVNIASDIVVLTFPASFLDYYLNEARDTDGFTRFIQHSPRFCVFEDLDYGLEKLLRDSISEEEPTALEKMEMHTKVLQFLIGIFQKVGLRKENSAALHPEDLQKLFMISGILKANLHGSPPSIDQLAREAGMSASKLKRGFKQVFGIPPYQYYLKAKMGEARILLESKQYAISEVGHLLGYSNLSKFSQAFKKEFGMTPRQYRGTI